MKTILVLILFATIGFTADNAEACSCAETSFENELRIGNGVIPENARGLGWHFTRAQQAGALEDLVEVTRLDQPALDDGFVIEPVGYPSGIYVNDEVATVFVIRPNEWEIGARFEVSTAFESEESYTNNRHFARGIFEIGEPLLSFPENLWVSDTSIETIRLNEPTVSCDAKVLGAVAAIGVSGGWETNLPNLDFETFVDGTLYEQTSSMCEYVEPGRNWYRPNRSWVGFDINRLVAICDSEFSDLPGLKPGTHSVQIRATLPGTTLSFDTLPTPIELRCPETVDTSDAEMDDTVMDDTEMDDTVMDDANNTDFADANADTNGGCTSTPSSRLHPIVAFLFFLAIIPFRRRRRSVEI